MEKFRLLKLRTDKMNISFNEYVNYISGGNATGKTTLIETIKYGLGLIKIPSILNDILGLSSVQLECLIGDKKIIITRENHGKILTISGDLHATIGINSKEINEFYNDLLQPRFINGKDETIAYDILKGTFMTDLSYFKSKKDSEFFKQVMGIDFSYHNQLKKEISTFEKDVYQEKVAFNILDKYHSKVNKSIKELEGKAKNIEGIKEIKEILTREYKEVSEEYFKNIDILYEAKNLLGKNESFLAEILDERISILTTIFDDIYFDLTGEVSDIKFSELINGKLSKVGSKREIILSAFYLTLFAYKVDKFHNSCGLFVVDVHRFEIDNSILSKYKKLVEKIAKENDIQYIETTINPNVNNRKSIIIDLDEDGKIYE
ncbi:hypothetical protein [Peribacillus butanolivorans]|uniref:hypothetical protein n=1 Tax=Peribacillus butanolivorans TaxID=421767 RepID=UPI00367229FF